MSHSLMTQQAKDTVYELRIMECIQMTIAVTEKGRTMEIDYKMNVHVPFEFCGKCNKIAPTTETLFFTDGEPYIRRNYCEYAGICKNVVELMNHGEREEE